MAADGQVDRGIKDALCYVATLSDEMLNGSARTYDADE